MIQILNDGEDYRAHIKENRIPVVLWGIGEWGKLLIEYHDIEVSDICDADPKKQGKLYSNKEILSPEQLEKKYKGKRFLIINTYGTSRKLQAGLYIMVCRYQFDAILVNLHSNIGFDLDVNDFEFCNKRLALISHIHNCGYLSGRTSERSIEVAMAKEWISQHDDKLIEIGAVTPYYYPGIINDVVDPADTHCLVTIHKSIFDVDLTDRNVLCLSTVEHIGTGQYGVGETKDAVMAIDKIMNESKHCLITTPIGENDKVDNYLREHLQDDTLFVYLRKFYGNRWELLLKPEMNLDEVIDYCKKVASVYEDRELLGANCGNIVIMK